MDEIKYVPKEEVKKYKKEMQDALNITRDKLKEKKLPYFSVGFVGSAKRNLVLRKGNSKYDVDFQLYCSDKNLKPNYREDILKELKKHLSNRWTFTQSTSVITAIKHNEKSFDIALINKKADKTAKISIIDKKSNQYIWNEIKNSSNLHQKIKQMKSEDWILLRKKYKKLRENQWEKHEIDKKPSYALYVEAINNIINNK